jgi:hypothetical protein
MDTVRVELEQIIRGEEHRLQETFPYERRMAVIELARAADTYAFMTIAGANIESDDDDFYAWGWPKALALFIDDSCNNENVLLFSSNDGLKSWAHSVILRCRHIALCEHLLKSCRAGLGTLFKPSPNEIHFKFNKGFIGLEYLERGEFDWFRNLVNEHQKNELESLAKERMSIIKLMADRVRPWQQHFFGCDNLQEIDEFYLKIGVLHSQKMVGTDSFPEEASFGGFEFNLYRASTAIIVSWALKHLDFCTALLKKHTEMDLSNVLTLVDSQESMAEYLAAMLGIDISSANHALQVLILTENNLSTHCVEPGSLPPPFIKIGEGIVLRSLTGSLGQPFGFMLRELRQRYPADWSKATILREKEFRKELFHLFPQPQIIKIDRSINIKINRNEKTDIDAVVFDLDNGVLGLFQLKWQDPFGRVMKERESRKKNFLGKTVEWINTVDKWLRTKDQSEIVNTLNLKQQGKKKIEIKTVRLFVLGRNFAHFSGETPPDPRAAWGLWPQVMRLASEQYDRDNPVEWLHRSLLGDSPALKDEPAIEREEIHIGNKIIVISAYP